MTTVPFILLPLLTIGGGVAGWFLPGFWTPENDLRLSLAHILWRCGTFARALMLFEEGRHAEISAMIRTELEVSVKQAARNIARGTKITKLPVKMPELAEAIPDLRYCSQRYDFGVEFEQHLATIEKGLS